MLFFTILGKAAKNVNGVTLHSAFDINRQNEFLPLGDKKLAEYRNMFTELALVVIDEISMMDSNKLHSMQKRLSDILQNELSFGGVGRIGVGDVQQLEPISRNYIYQKPKHKPYQPFYEVKKLWEEFDVIDLKVNHRQGEKNKWTEILNKIRDGIKDEEVVNTLKSRLISPPTDDTKKSKLSRKKGKKTQNRKDYKVTKEDLTNTHIFYTNKDCNEHNADCLNFLDSEKFDIDAIEALPKGFKTKLKHGHTIEETGFAKKLSVKVGARIVLIKNLNTQDGLVNGSMGKVVGVEKKDSKIHCIVVAFDDEETGSRQRQKHPGISAKYTNENGTPIFKHQHEYLLTNKKTAKAKLLQFPLILAFALTCHKMQGVTIPKGSKTIIHWHNKLPPAMAYVM